MEDNLPKINLEQLSNLLIEKTLVKERVILAIAGPPASGKSTLAKNIAKLLNTSKKNLIYSSNGWFPLC